MGRRWLTGSAADLRPRPCVRLISPPQQLAVRVCLYPRWRNVDCRQIIAGLPQALITGCAARESR
jgi:hypothetical protein